MSAHPDSTGASRAVTTSPIRRFHAPACSAGTRPSRAPPRTGLASVWPPQPFDLFRPVSSYFDFIFETNARLPLPCLSANSRENASGLRHARRTLTAAPAHSHLSRWHRISVSPCLCGDSASGSCWLSTLNLNFRHSNRTTLHGNSSSTSAPRTPASSPKSDSNSSPPAFPNISSAPNHAARSPPTPRNTLASSPPSAASPTSSTPCRNTATTRSLSSVGNIAPST